MCSKTSLRYVLQMITASHLLAKRRKSEVTEVDDVKRCYALFFDQARSQQYLDEYQSLFSLELAAVDAEGDVEMRDAK